MNFLITIITLVLVAVDANFPPRRRCQNTQFECDNGNCIQKQYWCISNNYHNRYCSDNSHNRNCGLYTRCAKDQIACDINRKCIPLKWACDGYRDCSDGSDEKECLDGYRIKDKIIISKEQARTWLVKQRRINWGWESNTHRAISALYLSNPKQFNPGNADSKLMTKQLQIQLSNILLRGNSIPMHEIALYTHSLLSTCLDPRQFQYHDLVLELKRSLEKSDAFNPFIALALCNANSTFSSKSISQLIEIMNKPHKPEWIEQQAFAVMTLICLQNRSRNLLENILENINITDPFVSMNSSNITSVFKPLQHSNGSFGSLYTTALVLQAFQADNDDGDGWNRIKALQYLMSEQRSDGSFDGDILSTYLILPVLNERSLVDLGNVDCASDDSHIRNLTVKEELDSINSIFHKITYIIVVGLHQNITFFITFTVPANTTFHDTMRLAEELDPRYRFRYIPYSWGNYIYSIFGVVNDPEAGQYWQLYQIKDTRSILVGKAPDRLIVEDNGKYAYWYRPTTRVIRNGEEPKKIFNGSIFG